jgi:hypothetical protein
VKAAAGARDASCLECAGGAGSAGAAGPPPRAALAAAAPSCVQPPPCPPSAGSCGPPVHTRPYPYCITLRLPAGPRAALFAFDLPVYLNYWLRGGLFSKVCRSRPVYCFPMCPPTWRTVAGRVKYPWVGRLPASADLGVWAVGAGHHLESGVGTQTPAVLMSLARRRGSAVCKEGDFSAGAGATPGGNVKALARRELDCWWTKPNPGETSEEERTSAN